MAGSALLWVFAAEAVAVSGKATKLGRGTGIQSIIPLAQPCWCGSGLPYERCHLRLKTAVPPPLKAVAHAAYEGSKEPPHCEHPEAPHRCQGPVIRAHVIQRADILESVAEDGHVLTFRTSLGATLKAGTYKPGLLGIRQASVFPGFCQLHDTEAFQEIEQHAIVPTRYQAFLLGYRAMISEMRSKREMKAMSESLHVVSRSPQPTESEYRRQMEIRFGAAMAEAGLKDIAPLRAASDRAIRAKDATDFSFLVVRLAGAPVTVASQIVSPEFAFSPTRVQDWRDFSRPLDHISFNLLPGGSDTLALFGWHTSAAALGALFVTTLQALPRSGIADAIHRFAFANAEQVYFKPSWWASLGEAGRQVVVDLCSAGISRQSGPGDHLPNSRRLINADVIEICTI